MKNIISKILIAVLVGLFIVPTASAQNANDLKFTQRNPANTAWADRIIPPAAGGTLTDMASFRMSIGALGTSSLGTGVQTWLAIPTSANLAVAVTDETGSGSLVFANTPTLISPILGNATTTSLSTAGNASLLLQSTSYGHIKDGSLIDLTASVAGGSNRATYIFENFDRPNANLNGLPITSGGQNWSTTYSDGTTLAVVNNAGMYATGTGNSYNELDYGAAITRISGKYTFRTGTIVFGTSPSLVLIADQTAGGTSGGLQTMLHLYIDTTGWVLQKRVSGGAFVSVLRGLVATTVGDGSEYYIEMVISGNTATVTDQTGMRQSYTHADVGTIAARYGIWQANVDGTVSGVGYHGVWTKAEMGPTNNIPTLPTPSLLVSGGASIALGGTTLTGGTLTLNTPYLITSVAGNASFTGVGATSNTVGTWFYSSGTTPTWGAGSVQTEGGITLTPTSGEYTQSASPIVLTGTTDASSVTTGVLQSAGGISAQKNIYSKTGLFYSNTDGGSAVTYGLSLANNAASGSNNNLPGIVWNSGAINWADLIGNRISTGGFGGTLNLRTQNTSGTLTSGLVIDSAQIASFPGTTDASSVTTGTVTTAGGISSQKNIYGKTGLFYANSDGGSSLTYGLHLANNAGSGANNKLPGILWDSGTIQWMSITGLRDSGGAFGGTMQLNTQNSGGTLTTALSIDKAQVVTLTNSLPVGSGGTGQTTYTNGQLLIGNTTGNTLAKATLTAGAGVSVTNGTGTITIAATTGIPGTTTNDSATAGNLGEFVSSAIASGSAVSLTTATAANVTSISLTAGDWDVEGNVNFSASTATVTGTSAGISSTSATLPTDGTEAYSGVQVTLLSELDSVTMPRKRISIAGTTTVYLVGKSTFSAGTVTAFGAISARRVR